MNSCFLDFEVFLAQVFDEFSLVNKELSDCFNLVFTSFWWTLYKELASFNVSNLYRSRENNITQLLFGSQITEEWLVQVLHNNSVDELALKIRSFWSTLKICNSARVFICFILKRLLNNIAITVFDSNWLNFYQILYLKSFNVKNCSSLFN